MTPEEIVAELDEKNREALVILNATPNQGIMRILNEASMRGFKLGSEFSASAIQGALLTKLVSMDKSKEG